MTLRAYRPDDYNGNPNAPRANDQLDWQDTLLDRPNQGLNRQQPLRASYGSRAPRSRIWWLTGLFALAAVAVTAYFVVQGRSSGNAIPLVTADTTPYKEQPEQPGGADIPFKDKLVFNRLDPNGQPVQAEKLLPPPEEPNAARSVTAPPATTPSVTTTTTTVAAPAAPSALSAAPTTVVQTAPATTVTQAPAPHAAPATAVTSETTTQTPVQRMVAANQPANQAASQTATQPATVAANPKTGTQAATAPVATTTTTVTQVAPVTAAPAAKPVAAAPVTTTGTAAGGQVRIQLASIPDQANAEKALPQLSGKFAGALGGARLSLVKADIAGKGTYYRVQSQPLDRAKAETVCSAIKAQGGVCIIAK